MKNKTSYSKIIAGTMTWGNWGKKLSVGEGAKLIGHCLDQGITTFDHADIYGSYNNELLFGNAFTSSNISRDKIQLISKCGIQMVCEERKNSVKHYNYSKDYIIWSVEQSLKNLKTDYLDMLLLHRPSPLMCPGEIGDAVQQLKKEGKILDFGVSNFTPSQVELLETTVEVQSNQLEFSLTANEAMNNGGWDDCIIHKRMAMAWSPLGSYYRDKNKRSKRIKKVLKQLKKKYQVNASQLLLAWIFTHPAAVHPVVGTTNPKRLSDAMKATEIDLEQEDWFMLLAASMGEDVP
ncbi:aldo/keto reductase [Arenibacter sp. TNZ]|jgi:predicted oxidoreductase|uniref:aldo/keto reductase n=1 Tax=Arenibacter TaxID=178469 RepID=UPI000CD41760|nr:MULTISPECIES: aldo/keto reductase [Arenibacter]MCM4171168.1 aldo/keto reductase [Arenibacter sp. TNZ]